jgi:NDP-sugar pyrophosphorylase family protein
VTETEGTALLRGILDDMSRRADFKKLSVTDLLGELVKKSSVTVVYTKGGWIDVDDLVDFIEAGGF